MKSRIPARSPEHSEKSSDTNINDYKPRFTKREKRQLLGVTMAALTVLGAGISQTIDDDPTFRGPTASDSTEQPSHNSKACEVVVVEPGDNPWELARVAHPDGDVRPVVDAIVKQIKSPDHMLHPGDEIKIC